MNAIDIRDLTYRYGDHTAVDGLTLEIREGELFALLGVNGAGKTTTIRMLCGVLRPCGGDAVMLGHSVVRDADAVRRISNVSPQESAVAPRLSVYENLIFAAGIYGMDAKAAADRAERMIEAFEMQEVRAKRAGTLSGGWMRRLSIAMALITDPKVLFLDEPTLGLDVLARRELWNVVKGLHGKVTILLTTHYMEEAEALADRIGVMQKGRLCAVGTAEELKVRTGTDSLEAAFVAIAAPEGGELA